MITAYRVFSHDLASPTVGGAPIIVGQLPYRLPVIHEVGWHAGRTMAEAIQIGGLWRNGRPTRLFRVETDVEVIECGKKLCAKTWDVVEELSIEPAIRELSSAFGDLADEMVREQLAWHTVPGRPCHDEHVVKEGLLAALAARGLDWELRRYETVNAIRISRDRWEDNWTVRDAYYAFEIWRSWDSLNLVAREAWIDRGVWLDRGSWSPCSALITFYNEHKCGNGFPERLTVGIRSAYCHGLWVAVAIAGGVLGWVMDERE